MPVDIETNEEVPYYKAVAALSTGRWSLSHEQADETGSDLRIATEDGVRWFRATATRTKRLLDADRSTGSGMSAAALAPAAATAARPSTPDWNPELHPRGPDGRFIEVPGVSGLGKILERVGEEIDLSNTTADDNPAQNGSREAYWSAISSAMKAESDYDAETVDAAIEHHTSNLRQWKEDSYTDAAQETEKAYKAALGLENQPRNGELDGGTPTEAEIAVAGVSSAVERSLFEQAYADTPLHRSIQKNGIQTFVDEFLNAPDAESYMIEENTIANYSALRSTAITFNSGLRVRKDSVDSQEVVGTPDMVQDFNHEGEQEVWLASGDDAIDRSEIRVFGKPLTDFGSNMDGEGWLIMSHLIRRWHENGGSIPPERRQMIANGREKMAAHPFASDTESEYHDVMTSGIELFDELLQQSGGQQ